MNSTIIKQKISSAPEDIQNIIFSLDIIELEEKITQEINLKSEQSDRLRKEIIFVLIGLNKRDDLLSHIIEIGIAPDAAKKVETEIDEKIFSKARASIEKLQKELITNKTEIPTETQTAAIKKEDVLNEIENPVPAKPAVSNPAGKNIVLDAQHNLPEQEKKILISSAAVPSRGPLLGNFANGFVTKTTTPSTPKVIPVIPSQPVQPKPSIQPQSVPQIPKPPVQNPINVVPTQNISKPTEQKPPEAPKKYSIDPYREPIE